MHIADTVTLHQILFRIFEKAHCLLTGQCRSIYFIPAICWIIQLLFMPLQTALP